MFSYFTKDDFMALRLPEPERSRFIGKYNATLVEQYGIVQKEYIRVPDKLLENTNELKLYFDTSYHYVSILKPKATTRSKKN